MESAPNFSAVRFPARNNVNNVEMFAEGMSKMPMVLRQLGFPGFRKGQEDVVASIMCQRDTLCILPTGHGKSAAFITPTLALNWRALVFSPLVALMRDQVKKLWGYGIAAAQMSSTQNDGENVQAARRWMAGELQFLYVAPERFRNEWFKNAMQAIPPDFIIVDEAHTLSQWSDGFRPDYCRIGDFIRERPPKVVAAFTATCPDEVEADIRRVLCMQNAVKLMYYPRRKNLKLRSRDLSSDFDIVEFIQEAKGQTIVYCSTIKKVEEMTRFLQHQMNQEVGMYHGSLTPAQKRTNQDMFMSGHLQHMVATNAFGMGVDKADIRGVVHRSIPGSLEALSQEVGRAGRDGKDSTCMTFYDNDGKRTQEFFISLQHPSEQDIRRIYHALTKLRDVNGVVNASYDQIAKAAGGKVGQISAALKNMTAASCIERHKQETRCAKVRFLEDPKTQDLRFIEYKNVIQELGVEKDYGLLEFSINAVEDRLQLAWPTIKKYLEIWNGSQYLHYEPPPKGADTRIIGPVERVEFERLKIKADDAHAKLAKVLEYVNIPDADKHSFLEAYFGIEYTE